MNLLSRLYRVGILVTGVLLASVSYADKSTEKKCMLSANKVSQENCTPFDLKSLDISKVKGRWKLVDGKTVVHDFGYKAKHAEPALLAIRQYGRLSQGNGFGSSSSRRSDAEDEWGVGSELRLQCDGDHTQNSLGPI